MRENEFLTRVQDHAGLGSIEEARTATNAVLGTLGRRLDEEAAGDLAAQLPEGIADPFITGASDDAEEFSREEFEERVASDLDGETDPGTVVPAVSETLAAAVSEGELSDLRDRLPEGYDDLLRSPETGGRADTGTGQHGT